MADYLGMGEESGFPQQLLNQQQQLAGIANTKATTQHTLASSDYISNLSREAATRGDMAQLEFDTDKQIADLNAISQGDSGPQDPMDQLTRDAGMYFKAGLVKKGTDLLKAASQITSQQATATARVIQASAADEKAKMQSMDKILGALGAANDDASWEEAKRVIAEVDPKAAATVQKMGAYSPEKAAYYANATTAYKDRMKAENDARRTNAYEAATGDEAARRAAQTRIDEAKLALARQREARLAKTGGKAGNKPAGMPSKAEVTGATDQLKELGIEADDSTAQEVAQQARIRWKSNPGLTPSMATTQVIQDMIKTGEVTPGKKEPGFLGFGERQTKGTVFSASKAVPLPPSPDKFVKGQYYQTEKGIVQYVDGVHDKIITSAGKGGSAEDDDGEEE
jgi:hypothetical protein